MVNDPNLKMFLDCISWTYNQNHITSPVNVTNKEFRFLFASRVILRRAVLHCITKFFTKSNGESDPCLIFSFLEGWCNTRPDDDHCEAYIKQLRKVVNILNFTGVVHTDLRPANIMWNPFNNHDGDRNVQLQVIDFKDALMVGSGVHEELAPEYSKDVLYPIKRGSDCKAIRAKVEFNNFFMDAIEAWLNRSKEKEFVRFMIMSQTTITYYD